MDKQPFSPVDQPPKRFPGPAILALILASVLTGIAIFSFWPASRRLTSITEPPRPESPFLNTRPDVAYVGDQACMDCHADIANEYATHSMARSMQEPAEILPDQTGKVLKVGNFAYEVEHMPQGVIHREISYNDQGHETGREEAVVRYILGSGTRGHAFLVERSNGLYQSPLGWYSQKGQWDLAPGYAENNAHFRRPITTECLFCHTNRIEEVPGAPPLLHGLAIGCERCHGPGQLHIEQPGRVGGFDPTIVNPAHLESSTLRDAVCEQCHKLGSSRRLKPGKGFFDYRPGLPLDDIMLILTLETEVTAVSQVEQLHKSACYTQSQGRLGCISCHDPHRLPPEPDRVAYYRDRCLSCHQEAGCTLPLETRQTRSAQDDCVSCHMPRSGAADVAHTTQTLHHIVRNPEDAQAIAP